MVCSGGLLQRDGWRVEGATSKYSTKANGRVRKRIRSASYSKCLSLPTLLGKCIQPRVMNSSDQTHIRMKPQGQNARALARRQNQINHPHLPKSPQ